MSDLTLDVVSAHPDYTPNKVDYEIAKPLFSATFNDYSFTVSQGADDSAFLMWSDGINEWIEHYEKLSHAIARLALLQGCAESVWEKCFTQNPKQFVNEFSKFTDCAI